MRFVIADSGTRQTGTSRAVVFFDKKRGFG